MDKKPLRDRLAQEAYEYLADFRNLAAALKRAEGWFTLGLVLAVIFMLAVWFINALGFDRLNMVISALGQSRARMCKPLSDFAAMVIIIDAVTLCMLALLALGEMMRLLDRVRQGLPRNLQLVSKPTAFMLAVGIVGIVFMRSIC